MICVALSLTLTLSRWEREQPLAASVNVAAVEQKSAVDLPGSWVQFSLSQREQRQRLWRVRENTFEFQLRSQTIFKADKFLNSIGDRRDACPTT